MKSRYENDGAGDSNGSFTLGLLVGATAGAFVAMLLSPKSGYKLSNNLRSMLYDQKQKVQGKWEATKAIAAEKVDEARLKLDLVAEHAKDTVDDYADRAKEKVDQLADGTKATVEKIQGRY
ncbi:YtxH domain-containing protein [Dyadobacter sandarakinus]|uniref:YtxH domain-containing protein n=1 Tax=Dyadobacter sandarakinus TaxID=2747268 RepID=A0ABX7I3S5_9BACT|nr:YtxH domain-containing protein [Dyadobacter sandarakinus]QRR00736.1 YtxH domain-containing protein [Dyadobacter sandarakinus]